MRLKFLGSRLKLVSADSETPITSIEDLVQMLMCCDATDDCYVGECTECPRMENLEEALKDLYFNSNVSQVSFKCWDTAAKCELKSKTLTVDDFVSEILSDLVKFAKHAFLATKQIESFKRDKESSCDGEVLVVCDYSENYSMVFQNEVQAAHWNNVQATLHVSVVYFKVDGQLKHFSHVVVSPHLKHDVYGVHLFLSKLVKHIKSKVPWTLSIKLLIIRMVHHRSIKIIKMQPTSSFMKKTLAFLVYGSFLPLGIGKMLRMVWGLQ
jgi:hypothetical protein